jgi:hypothetical protein
VINTVVNIVVAHENDMLLHIIIMASVKVRVRIGNKILETTKVSTIKTFDKSKSGPSINEMSPIQS